MKREELEFSNRHNIYKKSSADAHLNHGKISNNNLPSSNIAKDYIYDKKVNKISGNMKKLNENSRSDNKLENTITLYELDKDEKLKSNIEHGIQMFSLSLMRFILFLLIIYYL